MPINYRRPGVYLQESLLVNPAEVGTATTVAAFIGVAPKGPINEPMLVESWSDYVNLFGSFEMIVPAIPVDPNDISSVLGGVNYPDLATLKADPNTGDGYYSGPDFTAGQYVLLGDDSQAYYNVPAASTNKGSAAPGQGFAAEATVTAEDQTNADKLTGLGFIASPNTDWTDTQAIYVGGYRFGWDGTKWIPAPGAPPDNGVWTAGAYPGQGEAIPASTQVISYLPFSVYSFFQNGGRPAWIIRSAPTATASRGAPAAIAVNASGTGPDLLCFNIQARSVGKWGNNLQYALTQQALETNGQSVFSIQILQINADNIPEVVETFSNLSMTGDIPGTRRVDSVMNDPYIGSRYVQITGINPMQYVPAETSEAVSLEDGEDPGLPDVNDLQESAKLVSKVEGPINLNIAGYLDDASTIDTPQAAGNFVSTSLRSDDFPDREDIFIINDACPPRSPGDDSATYLAQIEQHFNISVPSQDSYVACYAPWITIPHPQRVGSTVTVPPGGAVSGMIGRIDSTIGVFRAPAGVVGGLANAVGVQTKFTDSQQGDLNYRNVNLVRSVVGSGICVMGARTRKNYGPDHYVSARRTLIYIKETLRRSTQWAVFENNDERLWSGLRQTAERILRPLWEAGGLRGGSASDAYFIRCDDTLNTLQVISQGEVRMEVGVALEYPAEFVIIRITQFDRGSFTGEVQPTA